MTIAYIKITSSKQEKRRDRELCCNMSRWSSAIIFFISWFFVFIDDNDNDDESGENENDDKNNYKQEFPCGRTLTLHYLFACKYKREREKDRWRKTQLANFWGWDEIPRSLPTLDWTIIMVYRSHRSMSTFFAILRGFMFWHCLR
jgi:hypothetical protein